MAKDTDTVCVVRCEHCEHYHSALAWCDFKRSYWFPNDFCNHGKPKDEYSVLELSAFYDGSDKQIDRKNILCNYDAYEKINDLT